MQFAWLYWNPNPIALTLPIIDWPIYTYALCFVFGLVCGYFILIPLLAQVVAQSNQYTSQVKKQAYGIADRLTWYIIIGMVVGARLGHVFFYDWDLYKHNLLQILNIRGGGLASHGGTLGILFGLLLFHQKIKKEFPQFTFPALIDVVSIPTAFAAIWIRIGNFFNQEIVGTPSQVPWAIIFGAPREGGHEEAFLLPRHPVQLYEALAYLMIFIVLLFIWKKKFPKLKPGFIGGLFFILLFSARFFIEFFKAPQESIIDQSFLQIGQYLSIPMIGFGILLLISSKKTYANGLRNTEIPG